MGTVAPAATTDPRRHPQELVLVCVTPKGAADTREGLAAFAVAPTRAHELQWAAQFNRQADTLGLP
jgi:hypothetical protein